MAVPLIMLLHSAFDQAPALFGDLKIREFSGNALDFTNYGAWAICAVIVAILTRGRLRARQPQPESALRTAVEVGTSGP